MLGGSHLHNILARKRKPGKEGSPHEQTWQRHFREARLATSVKEPATATSLVEPLTSDSVG